MGMYAVGEDRPPPRHRAPTAHVLTGRENEDSEKKVISFQRLSRANRAFALPHTVTVQARPKGSARLDHDARAGRPSVDHAKALLDIGESHGERGSHSCPRHGVDESMFRPRLATACARHHGFAFESVRGASSTFNR